MWNFDVGVTVSGLSQDGTVVFSNNATDQLKQLERTRGFPEGVPTCRRIGRQVGCPVRRV